MRDLSQNCINSRSQSAGVCSPQSSKQSEHRWRVKSGHFSPPRMRVGDDPFAADWNAPMKCMVRCQCLYGADLHGRDMMWEACDNSAKGCPESPVNKTPTDIPSNCTRIDHLTCSLAHLPRQGDRWCWSPRGGRGGGTRQPTEQSQRGVGERFKGSKVVTMQRQKLENFQLSPGDW